MDKENTNLTLQIILHNSNQICKKKNNDKKNLERNLHKTTNKIFLLFTLEFLIHRRLRSLRTFEVEPRYNKPLYNEVLEKTNNFLYPSNSKIYEKEP